MKWISAISLLHLLILAFSANAEVTHKKEICKTESHKISRDAIATVEQCHDTQTVSVIIKANTATLSVLSLKKTGTSLSTYQDSATKNTILIINGGFFGYSKDGAETPIGLVRSNGNRINPWMEWDHGGVLVSDQKKSIKIIPAQNAKSAGAWKDAIQSKPIIINSNMVDVSKNKNDSKFNRVAIGLTLKGDILVIGQFQNFGQAATLVDFSHTFKKLADHNKLKIHRALAMDGGVGAQIYLPTLNLAYGDSGRTYLPNAVRFDTIGTRQ